MSGRNVAQAKADLAIVNSHVITLDPRQPRAEAIAIAGDRILCVGGRGDIEASTDRGTRIIDLAGKTVMPGFIDAHSHIFFGGVVAEAVDVTAVRNIDDIVAAVAARAAQTPQGRWIRGYGFSIDNLAEQRHPTRTELDQATTDHPVWVTSDSFHSSSANSLGFDAIDLDPGNPGLEHDATGEPTGAYVTDAANIPARQRVFGFISEADAARMIRLMAEESARRGITTMHAFEGSRMSGDRDLGTLLEIASQLPIRIIPYYETFDVDAARDKRIRGLGGCGRCNLDGMPNTFTAALIEPYSDQPTCRGELHYAQEKIDSFILDAYARGIQVGMHAMGDAAIEQLLLSHERARSKFPDSALRHRIEHFHLPNAAQIERAARLGLVLAMHPIFAFLWSQPDGVFERRFGKERHRRVERYRDLIDAGCTVAIGADLPVHPPAPFLWLSLLTNNPIDPSQSITLDEALRIAIRNGAYAGHEEHEKGSLAAGKLADMIVIDRDPYRCSASELATIGIDTTIVGGCVVYSRSVAGHELTRET